MTDNDRSPYDYPEPYACFAEGYASGCGCESCLVIRSVREEASASVPRGTSFR